MSLEMGLTLAIFVMTILGLVVFQAHSATVFAITLLTLLTTGLADEQQFIASVANPGLLTLVLLIVCSLALEKTHLLRLISQKVMVRSYGKSWLRLVISTAFCSALLNNTAVVATLLASVRNNPYHSASKLLLPLSYAAILGGTLTLIGTSTNLIINSFYLEVSNQSLGFLSFACVGIFLLLAGLITLWFSHQSLANKPKPCLNSDGYFLDARLEPNSPLIGRSIEENGLRHLESLFLVELVRAQRLISPVNPHERLQIGDKLIFCGDISKVMQLTQFEGLSLFAKVNGLLSSNLIEVVIRDQSELKGQTLKQLGFRARFDAAVVAIKRDGGQLSGKLGDIQLKAGDYLVLAVGRDFKSRQNLQKNFITVSGLEPEKKITGGQSWVIVFSFLAAISASALEWVNLLTALCVLLGGYLLSGFLTVSEVTRRLPLEIWLVVSSALLLSQVFISTGTANILLSLTDFDAKQYPHVALILLYLASWIFTEFMTNNAAAAMMFPIAWTLSQLSGLNPLPFVMTVTFAASACFISPYGYQTNLMVLNAGNYCLVDYIKVGLPVSVVYALVVVLLVPCFFPFYG